MNAPQHLFAEDEPGNRAHAPETQAREIHLIYDNEFVPRTASVHVAHLTGAEILGVAGRPITAEQIVLQVLHAGGFESIRLDERADLAAGTKFIFATGDRSYRFFLNGRQFEWPCEEVSAALLLQLAGKAEDHDVLQELDGSPLDKLLAHDEVVSLAIRATEQFKTRPAPKTLTVYYNDNPVQIEWGHYTTEQLLALFQVEPGYILDLIRENGDFVELKPGDTLRVHQGQKFISHAPCGQSS